MTWPPAGCPDGTRIEIQHASTHGCEVPDVSGSGELAVGLEHESGSCGTALLGAGYTFSGSIYDVTGGGNVPTFEFTGPGPVFELGAAMVLEKQLAFRFQRAIDREHRAAARGQRPEPR